LAFVIYFYSVVLSLTFFESLNRLIV